MSKEHKEHFEVRAAIGLKVPYETKPRKYITDAAKTITVPATAYYLRRLASGELVEPQSTEEPAKSTKVKEPNNG